MTTTTTTTRLRTMHKTAASNRTSASNYGTAFDKRNVCNCATSRNHEHRNRTREYERCRRELSCRATPSPTPDAFVQLEKVIEERANRDNTLESTGWEQVEDSWILSPENPKALIHFTGGAFAGASPQLTYRELLEGLASKGFFIIATPFETNFEHLRITDEVYLKYTRATTTLGDRIAGLPVFGAGHSLGALLQLLLCSRYGSNREGNVLISFNNKPVTDAIPFYSELISPATSGLAPILSGLANSPQAKMIEVLSDQIRASTPSEVQQLFPLLDQLQPIYDDIANDRLEFSPTPQESRRIIQKKYNINRNLLVKFQNDTIDETLELCTILQGDRASVKDMDLTVRTLPGDHTTPCQQRIPEEIPSQIASVASQGSEFFGAIAGIAEMANVTGIPINPVSDIARNVQKNIEGVNSNLQSTTVAAMEQVETVAKEITLWSGIEPRVVRQLPDKS